jgi:hypothetical protein
MDLNQGKVVFKTQDEANKAAQRMGRNYEEPFRAYPVNGGWAVGGVFLKKPIKKIKSLSDMREILKQFKDSDDDYSVDQYTDLIESEESSNKVSTTFGDDSIWTLISYEEMTGTQLGMKTSGSYLVLEITNGIETKRPKMGGAFRPHIPLMKKMAESLLHKPVEWSTWNSKINSDKWANDSWFYKLELNDSFN